MTGHQPDGGDVERIDIEKAIVKDRLTGTCGGCPMSRLTLKQLIEVNTMREVPQIISVEAVYRTQFRSR